MIDYIFKNNWNNINELIGYLKENNIQSIGQGFFTKVFKINNYILKVNCGDSDYGFMEYKKYFTNNPSIHAPKCYQYKEIISNNNPHYIMLTEELSPFPFVDPEPDSIICLRRLLKENDYNIINQYKINEFDLNQIKEIFDFFKNFKIKNYSIDMCSVNLMLRDKTWVVNDPLVLLQ